MGVFDLFRQDEPGSGTDIDHLIEKLRSSDPDCRKTAISDLQAFGKPALLPLVEKTKGADDALRIKLLFVLYGLSDVTPSEVCTCMKTHGRMENKEIIALLSLPGRNALSPLLKMMADPDHSVRMLATGALAEVGEPGVPVLVRALSHRSHRIRAGAAEALVRQKWAPKNNDEYLSFLIAQEQWPDLIRARKNAVPYLIDLLSDRQYGIRMEAAKALGAIGDPKAIPALGGLLANEENEMCICAIEALEKIQNEKAIRPLVDALSHHSYNIRHVAATALSSFDWTPDTPDERARFYLASEEWHELTRMGRAAIPYLVEMLANPRYSLRVSAAGCLKAIGPPGREALVAATRSKDPLVRSTALEILNESVVAPPRPPAGVPDPHPVGTTRTKSPAPASPGSPSRTPPPSPATFHPAPAQNTGAHSAEPLSRPAPAPMQPRPEAPRQREFVPPEPTAAPEPAGRERIPDFSGLAKETPEAEISDEEIASLISTLKSTDENLRTLAVDALGRIGPRAIDALAGALSDPSWEVRQAAADVLGRIPDERVTALLIEALKDTDEEVRATAARSLGRVGDFAGFVPLISALMDPDAGVRTSAEEALGTFGEKAASPLRKLFVHEHPFVRGSAAAILAKVAGADAIPDISYLFFDPDTAVQERAAVAIGSLGTPAIPVFSDLLAQPDPALRLLAVTGLYHAGPTAEEYLVAACKDGDAAVRDRALTLYNALCRKRDEDTALAPAECVIAPSFLPRSDFAEPSAPAPAAEPERQRSATSDEETIRFLIETLAHYSPQIQRSAVESLVMIGQPAAGLLIEALASPTPLIRTRAALVLGRINDPRAVPPLKALLVGMDPGMRSAAAAALGQMGDPATIPDLTLLLGDPAEGIRIAGVQALGATGHPDAFAVLIEALGDEEYTVRAAAAEVLTGHGTAAVPTLIGALCHPSRDIRKGAVTCLNAIGWEPESIEELVHYQIAREAWIELSQAGDCALDPLRRLALTSAEEDLRMGAVITLVKIESPGAIELLIEALRDKSMLIRRKAMNALIDRGESARDPLVAAADSSDPDIRVTSAQVLERLHRKTNA